MRAICKDRPGPGLKIAEVPVPRCAPHDVLIKVHHAGVCGTDLHIADWDDWARGRMEPPLTIGHEFAGEIAEIGPQVPPDQFTPGQLVTAEGHIVCGHCRQCRTGNGHICQQTRIIGVDRDGTFAEFVAMPAINVMALGATPTTVGAVMDPLGNAFHALLSPDLPGSTVLVLGCGPIGCFATGIARVTGAATVIAADINPFRLELAARMGAHTTLNPTEVDVVAAVQEATMGEGVDLVCEMSGHPTALKQALASVRLGGRVHLLGLPKEERPRSPPRPKPGKGDGGGVVRQAPSYTRHRLRPRTKSLLMSGGTGSLPESAPRSTCLSTK